VAVLALAAHVEHLLVLGVGVHARGLHLKAASLDLLLVGDAAGLAVFRGLAPLHLRVLSIHHLSPPPRGGLHLVAHLRKRVNGAVAHALIRAVAHLIALALEGHVALAVLALPPTIHVPLVQVSAVAGFGGLDGEGLKAEVHGARFKHRHFGVWGLGWL